LLPKDGTPEQLEHLGPAIGLFESASFETRSRQIETGDLILLATDGVTEAFDPEQAVFGFDRLTAILKDNNAGDAEGLVKRIFGAVAAFANGAQRSDDTTCLAVRLHDRN
jgi:sigma-B regulation protein RsbU (phosphoserine phosphatase)